jgi:hypothetical protein
MATASRDRPADREAVTVSTEKAARPARKVWIAAVVIPLVAVAAVGIGVGVSQSQTRGTGFAIDF